MFDDIPPAKGDDPVSESEESQDENQTVGELESGSKTIPEVNEEPDAAASLPYGRPGLTEPSSLEKLSEHDVADISDSDEISVLLNEHDATDLEDHDEEQQIELPDELPILPLKDTVVYPSSV